MPDRSLESLEAQVGETHRTVEAFSVEAGKVAEFACAIHDPADVYLDERAATEAGFEQIPAPPTFTRTSYFPHYRPAGIDESFGFDLGFDRRYVLHGEQRYEYRRPLLVGDSLAGETTLEDVTKRAGESGGAMTLAIFRTNFYDDDDELVLRTWNTRIETDGAPSTERNTVPRGTIEDSTSENDSREPRAENPGPVVETSDLERRDFVRYAGASGDFNPIHYDEPYATSAGHPSVFGQGMFSAGVASQLPRRWVGLGALSSFRTRFTARVFPGESLVVRGRVVDESTDSSGTEVAIDFEVTTAGTNRLVVEGDATAVVESRLDRAGDV